jgi:hypothetical protein
MMKRTEIAITYSLPCPYCEFLSPERGRIVRDDYENPKDDWLFVVSDTKGGLLLDHFIAEHAGRGTERIIPHG